MVKSRSINIIIFFIFFFKPFFGFSQNLFDSLVNSEDIKRLNNEISRLYKKGKYCNNESNIKITNIFFFAYEGEILPSQFRNKEFLKELTPLYFKYKSKDYLRTYLSYIYTIKGKLVATSNGRIIYCTYHYSEHKFKSEQKFIDKLIEIDSVLYFFITAETVRLSHPQYIFSINKNDEIFVLKMMIDDSVEILSLDKFIDENWDDFVKTLTS